MTQEEVVPLTVEEVASVRKHSQCEPNGPYCKIADPDGCDLVDTYITRTRLLATIDKQAAEIAELANACHDLLHTHDNPPELTPLHSFSPEAARVYELASRIVTPRAIVARPEPA